MKKWARCKTVPPVGTVYDCPRCLPQEYKVVGYTRKKRIIAGRKCVIIRVEELGVRVWATGTVEVMWRPYGCCTWRRRIPGREGVNTKKKGVKDVRGA